MIDKIQALEEKVQEKIKECKSLEQIQDLRVKILGKKGELTTLLGNMKTLSNDVKIEVGKQINKTKVSLTKMFEDNFERINELELERKISEDEIDISMPSKELNIGSLHPVSLVIEEMIDIVSELGFDIVSGPEIEYVKYNFDALNISKTHPSREKTDTFYITEDVVLRTQTSPVQIRYMLENKPPIMMISIGKVYRPDYDISHTPMFNQIEGLMIGKDVTFANFKAILETLVKRLFGEKRNVRFRPHFFPFTEPSAELDVECTSCDGKGCRLCKYTGWLEILGSGMVNVEVLKAVELDGEIYQGFAFGMGIERIAMLKYKIDDLRLFYENDIRFLEQFN